MGANNYKIYNHDHNHKDKVAKGYLVERSVDVDEAEGVDAEAEDIDTDQGDQRLGSLTHDLGHL